MSTLEAIMKHFDPIDNNDLLAGVKILDAISKRIEKDQFPAISDKINDKISANPRLLKIALVNFTQAVYEIENISDLEYESLFAFLRACLELARISVEDGHPYIKEYYEEFFTIVKQVLPMCNSDFTAGILTVMKQASVNIPDDIKAILHVQVGKMAHEEYDDAHAESDFSSLIEAHDNSFSLYSEILSNLITFDSDDLIAFTYVLLDQPDKIAKDAVVLFLLHSDKKVRTAVAQILNETSIHNVSGDGLRWMILLRNWLPEEERSNIDKVIKKLRKSGIMITPMQPIEKTSAHVTFVDGAGSQSTMVFIEDKDFKGFFSILVKQGFGIKDLWVQEDVDIKELADTKKMVKANQSFIGKIDVAYLDVIVPYFLGVSLKHGHLPGPDLLRIADLLGKSNWIPNLHALDFSHAEQLDKFVDTLQYDWSSYKFWSTWFLMNEASEKICSDQQLKKNDKHTKLFDIIKNQELSIWDEKFKLMAQVSKFGEELKLPPMKEFLSVSKHLETEENLHDNKILNDIVKNSL